MPTINRYANEGGYYIRARPSNAGNITYKIKEEGNPLIREYGLRNGDEISWSTIQSFKALRIIYTEKSGILGPDDFKPEPGQLKKTELAESEAQELFSTIITQFELSREKRMEIRSILGLSPEIDVEAIGDRIGSHLETDMESKNLSIRCNRRVKDAEETEISTWVEVDDSPDCTIWKLHILIIGKFDGESYFNDHCIHLCNKCGLEYWHMRVVEKPTWDIKQVAIEQQSVIFPWLLDELRSAKFDLGDPAEMLPPQVELSIGSAK